mgnify:CR=1 FL=1
MGCAIIVYCLYNNGLHWFVDCKLVVFCEKNHYLVNLVIFYVTTNIYFGAVMVTALISCEIKLA